MPISFSVPSSLSVSGTTTTAALTIGSLTGVLKASSGVVSVATPGTDFASVGAVTTSGLTMSTAKMLGRATGGTGAIEEITVTGSGSAVLATSPTLVTPILGAATGTSIVLSGTITDQGGTLASQRNALGATQALLFNGVLGAPTVIAAQGTGDFAVTARVICNDFSIGRVILDSAANGFVLRVNTSGFLEAVKSGVAIQLASTTALSAGVVNHAAYVRESGVGTFYVNGVAAGAGADTGNYSVATATLGGITNTVNYVSGFSFLNRAVSAADILKQYQTNAVAESDINAVYDDSGVSIGAGQQMINGANSTFASDTGWWTKSGTVIGAGVATMGAGNQLTRAALLKIGSSYTLTFTVGAYVSGTPSPFLVQCSGTTIIAPTSNGVKTVTFVANGTDLQFYSQNDTLTLDDVTLLPLGVLIAPEANAPGAGLEWLDVSGNRAHVVLPTSGVSWALPSSQQIVIEATTNTATNQQLAGASIIDTNKQWRIQSWTVNCSTGTPTISLGNASAGAQYVSGAVLAAGNNDVTLLTRFPTTANLWCNSSTTATLIHRIVLVPAN